jgi:hypothetical protein
LKNVIPYKRNPTKFSYINSVLVVPIEQRGIAQEVSLVTKRGVEAKNYEGVSILLFLH